jgi:glycosyltransferase involved in cell wall biosynthesis
VGHLAIVVSGFPRRSETFALNELLALNACGLLGPVFATKPGEPIGYVPLLDRVEVLPTGTTAEQADWVAHRVGACKPRGVHGYFAHEPAEIAFLAARQLGVAHGFSVHARDARKATPEALRERARSAACVIACNTDVAADIARLGIEACLIPHGVDLRRFTPQRLPAALPLRLLAVGRLVEKKGFHVLVEAAARIEVPVTLRIVGEGPQLARLQQAIDTRGLQQSVTLCGAMSHAQVQAEYAAAHVVVVPSVIDHEGDRDGLPNVVLEAMASGRPVVASDVAAIACAVEHERTGLLVPPGDPLALAATLDRLARDPAARERFGARGRQRVEADYDLNRCTARLIQRLETAYG